MLQQNGIVPGPEETCFGAGALTLVGAEGRAVNVLQKKVCSPDIRIRNRPGGDAYIRGGKRAGNKFDVVGTLTLTFPLGFIAGGVQSAGAEAVGAETESDIGIYPGKEIHGPRAVGKHVFLGQVGDGGLVEKIPFLASGKKQQCQTARS